MIYILVKEFSIVIAFLYLGHPAFQSLGRFLNIKNVFPTELKFMYSELNHCKEIVGGHFRQDMIDFILYINEFLLELLLILFLLELDIPRKGVQFVKDINHGGSIRKSLSTPGL